MTRTPEENALDEMVEEERREAAEAVVQSIPAFVANDFMEYEDWAAWAAPVIAQNSGIFAVEYLPEIHEAAERVLGRRLDNRLSEEIETAKAEISDTDLKALEEAGWRVGHDPEGEVTAVVMLVHDELERVWPLSDIPGAFRDIGVPVPGEADTPGMGP